MSLSIDAILEAAELHQASDVFLQEGMVPRLKINEQIMLIGDEPMSLQQMTALWMTCGANPQNELDRDSGLISQSHVRFRVNVHRTMGQLGAVLRRIKTKVPALDSLGVPDWLLTRWAARSFGLILVTGPTGTGKSTTIAALLQWMNENMAKHIVTIEDPVEFIFTTENSHFTQREVGRDTASFANGLRSAMRQAPDVIFVGEIRDYETALTALQAAETGHLVLSTIHSDRVSETMERFMSLFPQDRLVHGVNLLANQLIGVLCQKLVPTLDGNLHVLVEHVEIAGAMRDWIQRRDTQNIQEHLARGIDPAALTFMNSALNAWRAGIISEEVAIESVGSESEFKRATRGVH